MARHPGLLLRKLGNRLTGRTHPSLHVQQKSGHSPEHLPDWAPTLRDWLSRVPLAPPPHPFNRVFGLDFDESRLLQLCRQGSDGSRRGLEGDIKLIWDYSRAQPLVTNAAASPTTLDGCEAFVRRWLEASGDLNGPAWTSAMDVAIRAVNWVVADTLYHGQLGKRLGDKAWSSWLWHHGFVIWRRLEFHLVSSNHYFANLLGLAAVGSVFPQDPQARRWLKFAVEDFPRALLAQTRSDGGLNEASLRYHAYVTEMALLFRLIQGAPFPVQAEQRLKKMCQAVADFRDASGDVFAIGDDDTGRVLAIDSASSQGRTEILLGLAATVLGEEFEPAASAVYPDSGWWVSRAGDFALAMDFGGAGLWGRGSHAHSDDLSICLDWRNYAVITDPGTFLYTGDIEARNRFRSTLSHNAVVVDGQEQRVLSEGPFRLPYADRALPAEQTSIGSWKFSRAAGTDLRHGRELLVRAGVIHIRDRIDGAGRHRLEWRFHLHPRVTATVAQNGFVLDVKGAGKLLLEPAGAGLRLQIVPAEFSPGYGRIQEAQMCVAGTDTDGSCAVEWKIVPQT